MMLKRKTNKTAVNRKITKPYLTVKELSKESGLSEYYIRKLIASNSIPYLEAGRKFLINYELFMEFLKRESKKHMNSDD